MKKTPPWSVLYFAYQGDREVILDFFDRLATSEESIDCEAIIENLKLLGEEFDGACCLTHDHDMREAVFGPVRIFFVCEPERHALVVIDGLLADDPPDLFEDIRRKAEDYADSKN